jgi:hypothetical protein
MIARVVRGLAWLVLGAITLEVVTRQLTRTPLFPGLPESPWSLVLLGLTAAAVGLTVRRDRMRALTFGTALACGLAAQLQFGARLQSDAFYYYAYLRSVTFDRDVSLANDYRMLGLADKPHLFEPTVTGYAHSAWTMGPAIVWSPFFATGHLVASRLAAQGREIATDGSSYPYRQSIVIAGLVYALLGWWLTLRLCEHWFSTRLASTAVALMAGGSFMLWYTLVEPTMTHAPSMAAVAGFLLYWITTRDKRTYAGWIILGLIAGLMTLLRWQNVLFALVPACDAIVALWRGARDGDRARVQQVLVGGVLFTLVASLTFLPQMLAWKAIYGSYLAVSPVGPKIRLTAPQLELALFSSRNGLLAMTPILYVSLLGLIGFTRRHVAVGVPLMIATLAMVWFNASIQDWWGSDGFGGRRFDGIIPIAAIGLATALGLLQRWIAQRPQWIVGGAAAVLIVWNLTLMAAAQRGIARLGEAIPFAQVGGAQARIWHEWTGHPFSAPANLWFAVRNGVSPAAYDRLGPALFLGDPLQPTGRVDIGTDDALLLGDGWFVPEQDGVSSFRWATREAGLMVPLARTAPLEVQVRTRAFQFPGAPAQQLTMHIGGTTFGPFPIGPDWQVVTFDTPEQVWRTGLNRVRLVFAEATTPVSVGLGGDTRALAAAVDVVRVTIR